MKFEVKATKFFLKDLKKLSKKYKRIKEDYRNLLNLLENNPMAGIYLGKGIYKIRLKSSDMKKGKRGGFRVIYYLLTENRKVYLLTIYSKGEKEYIDMGVVEKILEELNLDYAK